MFDLMWANIEPPPPCNHLQDAAPHACRDLGPTPRMQLRREAAGVPGAMPHTSMQSAARSVAPRTGTPARPNSGGGDERGCVRRPPPKPPPAPMTEITSIRNVTTKHAPAASRPKAAIHVARALGTIRIVHQRFEMSRSQPRKLRNIECTQAKS